MSSMLFCVFLGFACAFPKDFTIDNNFHIKGLIMIWSFFAAQHIFNLLLAVTLYKFLKQCFIVFAIFAGRNQRQVVFELMKNKLARFFIRGININSPYNRFKRIR